MQKNNSNQLAEQLSSSSKLFQQSFVTDSIVLADIQLELLSKYVGTRVLTVFALPTRKFNVSIKDAFNFNVSLGSSIAEFQENVIFYPFLLQTSSGLYLVVASKFNIYDVLDPEPYKESLGEFRYQYQLSKALGLKNAIAYDLLSNKQIVDEKKATEDDLELMYCGDDEFSYLIYTL